MERFERPGEPGELHDGPQVAAHAAEDTAPVPPVPAVVEPAAVKGLQPPDAPPPPDQNPAAVYLAGLAGLSTEPAGAVAVSIIGQSLLRGEWDGERAWSAP